MMAEYTFIKDSDTTIQETIVGENIAGATITWGLYYQTEDLTGDLDALTPIFSKSTTAGTIVITDAPNGKFSVTIDDTDTQDLAPNWYYVRAKCTIGGLVLAIGMYEVNLSALGG